MKEVVRSQIEGRGLWVRLWVLGTGSIAAALLARSDPGNSDSHTSSVASGRKRTPVSCVRAARTGLAEIQACLEQLDAPLKQDSTRANRVFRQVLEPIAMTPVEDRGRRFYRATGAAKGAEMLNRLGLAQAVDFGGCGGPQPLAGRQVTRIPLSDNCLIRRIGGPNGLPPPLARCKYAEF